VALLVAAIAATFWPGVAMYDTVAQYTQVLSGEVDDWHPPIMVRLWQLLHSLGGTTGPMFALQVALYALGFALIAGPLGRAGRWRAAIAAAVLALSPLLLGWQMVVLKDAQMLGALVGAFGMVAQFRLSGRRVPALASVPVALLITYATLVRANAAFATIPLAVLLLPAPKSLAGRAAIAVAGILLVVGISPLLNHHLFGAAPSGVAKTQPLFDLAAIAVGTADPAPFTRAERDQLAARHCVKNFFWDPIADPSACGPVTGRVNQEAEGQLYAQLARAAAAHPIAYAWHRARHWNSTERWLVPPNLPDAAPPIEAEPNDAGLTTPASPFAATWQDVAAVEESTPLGWPILWTSVALLLLPAAWRRRGDAVGGLALALLVSALALEASFLAISIASDLRYHLWSMTASALALILLSDDLRLSRRGLVAGAAVLLLIAAGGILARASLLPAPDTYQGMIHAASG
jgi:hypothetical protein